MSDSKSILRGRLLDQIRADLSALIRTQKDTSAAATHAENKAEHAKDTRATEQSYLARGLAGRAAALEETLRRLARFELVEFDEAAGVAVGALVQIEDLEKSQVQRWWLVPDGGGRELEFEDATIRTVTPAAPLGRALLGLNVGDEGHFASPRGQRTFEVQAVR